VFVVQPVFQSLAFVWLVSVTQIHVDMLSARIVRWLIHAYSMLISPIDVVPVWKTNNAAVMHRCHALRLVNLLLLSEPLCRSGGLSITFFFFVCANNYSHGLYGATFPAAPAVLHLHSTDVSSCIPKMRPQSGYYHRADAGTCDVDKTHLNIANLCSYALSLSSKRDVIGFSRTFRQLLLQYQGMLVLIFWTPTGIMSCT
jgi:hypothetical protein